MICASEATARFRGLAFTKKPSSAVGTGVGCRCWFTVLRSKDKNTAESSISQVSRWLRDVGLSVGVENSG